MRIIPPFATSRVTVSVCGILKLTENGGGAHGIDGLGNLTGAKEILQMLNFLQRFGVGDGQLQG